MIDLHSAHGTAFPVSRQPASCTCERCGADAEGLDDESILPLIVEDRLRISLDCLTHARRMTRLVDDSTGIPLFTDLGRFAQFVRHLTRAVESHLRAMKAVLPVSATNLAAPDWKGER